MATESPSYTTEDGAILFEGDRAYDYYSMKPGKIGRASYDGWFDFEHDDGKVTILNGQRIATLGYARGRGWPGA